MDTAQPESPQVGQTGPAGAIPFGTLLRRYRLAAGLSQEELAERAGLSVQGLSALENGRRQVPYRHTVALLSQALSLDDTQRATFEAARTRQRGAGTAADAAVVFVPGTLPPLVGRSRELALLERHLAGEGPPVLLLAGEPGIGKSRLLRAAAERAPGHGWRVLAGGCQRRGGQDPYAPLLDALAGHLRQHQPSQARANLRGCAWLVRLLPELAAGPVEPLPAWTLPPEQERRLMVAAVERYLTNVAGPAGTLLLLDDLHWASPDALDLLITLARAAGALPLRVLGAYRDTETPPPDALTAALADLAQAGLAARQPLGPLAHAEAERLLATLLDGAEGRDGTVIDSALRERLVRRAGGVPFFLVSCARAVRAVAGDAEALPWDVAQSIRQRVAALGTEAQEVLGVAAVLGRAVEPELLGAVAEQPERAVLAALEAASRVRLLVEDGGAYQFGHDLIREVVEADMGAARRAALHRRAAGGGAGHLPAVRRAQRRRAGGDRSRQPAEWVIDPTTLLYHSARAILRGVRGRQPLAARNVPIASFL